MCVPYILIVWRLLPETTGKSLEEIEEMWIEKGSGRRAQGAGQKKK
jgi:hypothetical protein